MSQAQTSTAAAWEQAPLPDRRHQSADDLALLQRKALYHYEKSLNAQTPNEQTVQHRGLAKDMALQLRDRAETKTTGLNLLGRIALDEGFYALAEHHLKDALDLDSQDAGCWYSLGHVRLAQKLYDDALSCFSKALDIAPRQTRAATSLAYTLARKGNTVEAFQAYRQLFRVHPDDPHVQAKLFEILPMIQADSFRQDLEADTLRWMNVKNTNPQALATLVMSLMRHKYQLDSPDAIIDLQDLAKDALLNQALGKIYFTSAELEQFLVMLRKQVLLNSIAGGYADQNLLTLAGNLAMHAEHNEHISIYDSSEKDLITGLRTLINDVKKTGHPPLQELAHLIVLYAMYEPIGELDAFRQQPLTDSGAWPPYCRELIEHAIIEPQTELKLAKGIPQLTPITDGISQSVKAQYEENPYPRWLHLGYNTPTNYGRALENELIDFRAPDFFNMGTVRFLIAGAGTGQHALRVARYFRNAEVTAIDLSKRSLAYAKRQADTLGIKNLTFLCGDILELDRLEENYHVIECSGVLHHMQSPQAGLEKLKSRLVDRGLLKLGLYSYQARQVVREIRRMIEEYDVPVSLDGMRTMRQAIFEGKMPYDFSGILKSQDFYSASGCRDLLFHVQEVQYEPLELKQLIEHEKLNFLGFVLPEHVKNQYRAHYPDDPTLTNLANWQDFEQKNPATFAGMFQFYLQK